VEHLIMGSERITRKDALVYGGAAAVGVAAGGVAVAGIATAVGNKKLAVEGDLVVARAVSGALPVDDLGDTVWDDAAPVRVPLSPQQIAPPILEDASVPDIVVRALTNGKDLAFKLEWADSTVDDLDGIRRYHDAVAVQFPTTAAPSPPPISMGAPGAAVHVLQWRATWQRDIDSDGKTGVDQIYPAVVHDVMPEDILPPKEANLYWVGRAVGNPLSKKFRTTPVEEIVAEGFGSVTHLPKQTAQGRGEHGNDGWRVVMSLPADRSGVGASLAPGSSWPIAFAVWQGSDENRGGRKHISLWHTLQIESAS
jgi:Ethylbenzene dehydrogenase